jgi:hypothetical protein
MGGALEVGKLVAASYLYRYWSSTPKLLKAYLFISVFVLMIVTSLGIFGFLTAAYQTDSIGLKQQQEQIVLYEDQKKSYQQRLEGINTDIERTGANYITKRMELIKTYEEEKQDIIQNLEDIDAKLLELKGNVLTTEAKIGPIIYVAEVLGENPDKATFWFVLIIIGVFDLLAVSLTLAANIALRKRQEDKQSLETRATIEQVVEDAKHTFEDFVEHAERTEHEDQNQITSTTTSDAINELKEIVKAASNSEEIKAISDAVARMDREMKRSSVRSNLNKIKRL